MELGQRLQAAIDAWGEREGVEPRSRIRELDYRTRAGQQNIRDILAGKRSNPGLELVAALGLELGTLAWAFPDFPSDLTVEVPDADEVEAGERSGDTPPYLSALPATLSAVG